MDTLNGHTDARITKKKSPPSSIAADGEMTYEVGPGGVEPPTSRLSGVRSNHLSYEPLRAFDQSFQS
jgi:hypothetical protein